MRPKIFGAYTVLITPFDQNGNLDIEGLKTNIRFQLSHGIEGLVVLGTTGEAPTLTEEERELIISISRQETLHKCHLMVGTGSYSTQKTIKNTLDAQKAGVDSVLVVTPYYNKPTQEGLYQHFSMLAKSVDLPIVIYNIQGRTGQNLQTETLMRLATIENIVGVKEASGNIIQMMEVIENIISIRPDFSVMSGDDALTYPLMSIGGHGVYSVLSNLMPAQVKKLCDKTLQGDYPTARTLHYKLLPYIRSIFLETNPIPVKAVMNLAGYPAGPCRLPLCEMTKDNFERLKNTWSELIFEKEKNLSLQIIA